MNGGVGIGMDLWIGGSEFFENVITQGGTPSPFNYYEETCFTTQFAAEPSTSGFITIGIVRVGSIVNLLIPTITLGGPTTADTVHTVPGDELPPRFKTGLHSTRRSFYNYCKFIYRSW